MLYRQLPKETIIIRQLQQIVIPWNAYVNFFHINTLCSEKNTHLHFLSYLHELFVDLYKNCSEYIQGLTESDNVKIRYSLLSMT